MKIKKLQILTLSLITGILIISGCDLGNTTNPRIIELETDCINTVDCEALISIGFFSALQAMVSPHGAHMNLMADQSTSTNHFLNFYEFADEPRLKIDNRPTFASREIFTEIYDGLNVSVEFANNVLKSQANIDPQFKDKFLAQTYFMRGLARGYLGLIFDRGYLLDENNFDTITEDDLDEVIVSYEVLIEASIDDFDRALNIISNSSQSNIMLSAIPDDENSWGQTIFVDFINSFAARVLAGKARTFEEAEQLDWSRVLAYANKGLGGPESLSNFTDFILLNSGSLTGLFNEFVNITNQVVVGNFDTGAGYLPTDIKVLHLMDENYPTSYPEDSVDSGVLTMPEATTNDPRLAYFKYTTNRGFFETTRNRSLFSPYFSARMFANNNWQSNLGRIILITKSEIDYIRAEANLMLNQKVDAAAILEASPAGNGQTILSTNLASVQLEYLSQNGFSGGYSFSGNESLAEFQLALLREYSVELEGLGGIGLQWFFMRRHDLLQEGTPTMYPFPGRDLEIIGQPIYTFGGVENAGQRGTASGANSWKNLRAKISNQ